MTTSVTQWQPTLVPVRRLWPALALVATAWAALAGVLFAWTGRFSLAAVEAACGAPAPDVRTAPSVVDVQAFITGCGADGIAAYRDLQLVDLLYPAVNAALLALVIVMLAGRLPHRLGWLLVIPALAAVGDYAENVGAWALIIRGVDGGRWAEQLFQVGSAVKVGATWTAWVVVIALLGWVAARAVGQRSTGPDGADADERPAEEPVAARAAAATT